MQDDIAIALIEELKGIREEIAKTREEISEGIDVFNANAEKLFFIIHGAIPSDEDVINAAEEFKKQEDTK